MKKKIHKNIFLAIIMFLMASLISFSPLVFAEDKPKSSGGGDENAILKDVNSIEELLNIALITVSSGVGLLAIGSLIYAGVLYASAGANSSQVAKAKEMIRNTIIGIVAYTVMWAFLQWLIPGGVF